MKRLFISAVIASHDSEKTLPRAVESVLRADYGDDFEVIIVDDASRKKVEDYIIINPSVKIIRNDIRRGPAYSRNAGARISKGDVLLFIDSDVYIRENSFSVINNGFKEEEISALVGIYDTESVHRDFFSNYSNLRIIKADTDQGADFCHAGIYAIKKDVFTKAGGFDTKYTRASVEDVEFGIRLSSLGYKARMLKELSGSHDKKYTLLSLLRSDFIRSGDRVEFLLRLKQAQNIIRKRRFDHYNTEQLFPILFIPLLWMTIVLGFTNRYYYFAAFFLVLFFAYLNRGLLYFFYQKKGLFFYLKSVGFYLVDLGAFSLGVMTGLIANLTVNSPVKH